MGMQHLGYGKPNTNANLLYEMARIRRKRIAFGCFTGTGFRITIIPPQLSYKHAVV